MFFLWNDWSCSHWGLKYIRKNTCVGKSAHVCTMSLMSIVLTVRTQSPDSGAERLFRPSFTMLGQVIYFPVSPSVSSRKWIWPKDVSPLLRYYDINILYYAITKISEQTCQGTPDDLISRHASVSWCVTEHSVWKICYYADQHEDDHIVKYTLLGMAGNACSSSYKLHVRLKVKLKGAFLKAMSLKLA